MPLDPKTQLEQDAADRIYAETSYLEEPAPAEAMAAPLVPDPDEPHESEDPTDEELSRRA